MEFEKSIHTKIEAVKSIEGLNPFVTKLIKPGMMTLIDMMKYNNLYFIKLIGFNSDLLIITFLVCKIP